MINKSSITGLTLVTLLSITSPANADFVSLVVENITNNSLGFSEYALYATFDDPLDTVTFIFDTEIITSTGFFHNSIGGTGQSALPFTTEQTTMSDNPDADSFVTIGLMTGDDNAAQLGPDFDEQEFINGASITGSWFNSYQPNNQGLAGPDGKVLIAVFTPLNDERGLPGIISGFMKIGYMDPDLPPGQFAKASFYIPTPGTLGLFVMAVFIGKRRRRV